MAVDRPSKEDMNKIIENVANAVNSLGEEKRKEYIKLFVTKAMMFERVHEAYYVEYDDPDEMLRQNGVTALLSVELYEQIVDKELHNALAGGSKL